MRTISRTYRPGDEVQINRLYQLITGRDRSRTEYAWEWLETWDGQGSMDLMFDLDREEGDQLIAQYSLIPTPLSVWGRPTVAGKTENCMCHPDHRRTGLYFSHEQEWFEHEKQRYSFFFTTAGQVSHGAVGKIRKKLGYVAFDNWVTYTLWVQTPALREELTAILAAKGSPMKALAGPLGGLATALLQGLSLLRRRRSCGYEAAVHSVGEAPMDQIAHLWERNRERYGITVDRTARYLQWRINDDPYLKHEYLTIRDDDRLLGYAVYHVRHDTLYVVDLLVDGKRTALFRHLLAALAQRGLELGIDRIACSVLRRSPFLPRRLRSAGFLNKAILSPAAFRRSFRPRQFFLFIPEEWRTDPRAADNAQWYITQLVLEGRDYDQS